MKVTTILNVYAHLAINKKISFGKAAAVCFVG
jgi:hypothetical protein